jgi:two-component system, LytTR family, response regulator LytT
MQVLIIEDEAAAVRRLTKLIQEIEPEAQIVADLDSVEGTLNWMNNNKLPDLLFMDVNLADGNSFEIFNHVQVDKPIIFTTAYDEFAIKAFKVNALDYLLKPIKKAELEVAVEKFKKLRNTAAADYQELFKASQQHHTPKRFLIRMGQQIKIIDLKEAAYFYTQDKITFLITKEGKRYPIDQSLDRIEEVADPNEFFRINRQFILGTSAIGEMQAWSKSRVRILLHPPVIPETVVSTIRSPQFKKWLTGDI